MDVMGYRRADGTVGTRKLVGILSAVVCVNEVVEAIVRQVQGTARVTHHQGWCQPPLDIGRVNRERNRTGWLHSPGLEPQKRRR